MPEETKNADQVRTAAIREKIAAGLDIVQATEVVRAQEAWDASEEKKRLEAEEADRIKKAAKAAKA